MVTRLLDCEELERSEVVANAAMNRQRNLRGGNSYEKELGFSPLEFLQKSLLKHPSVAWLDVCCGSGRALVQAAQLCRDLGFSARANLTGIDLVPMFEGIPPEIDFLSLENSSFTTWQPAQRFDLITCIHGLHYVGDKLSAIQKAAGWLRDDGLFVAHLDYANLQLEGSRNPRIRMGKDLRQAGFLYESRHHRLLCRGAKEVSLPYRYLGANDQAGPNFTGQRAVDSHYVRLK
jgi:SAM-dependent methyltransferase